jgi:hypothetical protein
MALTGYCSECGEMVWLSPSGDCERGHPRSCLRGVHDAAAAQATTPLAGPGGVEHAPMRGARGGISVLLAVVALLPSLAYVLIFISSASGIANSATLGVLGSMLFLPIFTVSPAAATAGVATGVYALSGGRRPPLAVAGIVLSVAALLPVALLFLAGIIAASTWTR